MPDAYVFTVLGPDGRPLSSQLGAPYFLADSPGGLGTSVNYHNLTYSPVSKQFLAAYTTTPGVTYLAALQIHFVPPGAGDAAHPRHREAGRQRGALLARQRDRVQRGGHPGPRARHLAVRRSDPDSGRRSSEGHGACHGRDAAFPAEQAVIPGIAR